MQCARPSARRCETSHRSATSAGAVSDGCTMKLGPAAENRVELVFAGDRKTLVAAGFVAREPVAEIPAPRPLAHVARQRADVADLRRRHAFGGFGQHRVLGAECV